MMKSLFVKYPSYEYLLYTQRADGMYLLLIENENTNTY